MIPLSILINREEQASSVAKTTLSPTSAMGTFLETPNAIELLGTSQFALSEPAPIQKLPVAIVDSDRDRRKTVAAGRSYVFLGAKGSTGVTTVACNFAVALAQESRQSVLLIDLDLPMGDAALDLGIRCDRTTLDALENAERLDPTFLLSHLVEHSSSLRVLAAPGEFRPVNIVDSAVDRLLAVARSAFDYVVVDAGSRHDWTGTRLFDEAACIYLVTQVGIPELRNAHRLVTESIPQHAAKMEPVLNHYAPDLFCISDELISKSLTISPKWRIPSDFFSVGDLQNQASPLTQTDSPIARAIRRMARAASGLSGEPQKKKLFGLFG